MTGSPVAVRRRLTPQDHLNRSPEEPPRKCYRHVWGYDVDGKSVASPVGGFCIRCGKLHNSVLSRRGRQSRNYGNRAELTVARTYGGTKVGHAGGPVDVRGKEFATQVKTHRRLPPLEWRKAFAAMAESKGIPRILLRFVLGTNGQGTEDYIVLRAKDWLEWFGRDE